MTRKEANLKIMKILKDYIEERPDLRFTQILYNLGINTSEVIKDLDTGFDRYFFVDNYNEESTKTLKKIQI